MLFEAYHAVLWILCALCTSALSARLYIRIQCFHTLLVDDWIMILALVMLLSIATLAQVFLTDIYKLFDTENGKILADVTFPQMMVSGLRGIGAAVVIAIVGVMAVKISFLLFFKRLGTQITTYLVFWYVVLFITLACSAATLGLLHYKCVFGNFEYLALTCSQRGIIKDVIDLQIISVVLDIFSDLFIMCFPIIILWKVRISLRTKLILSCTFGLVLLTIAVTIARGSIFSSTFKKLNAKETVNLNPVSAVLWHFIEFAVAFFVACLISFRALFVQQDQQSYERQAQQQRLEQVKGASGPTMGRRSCFLNRARLYHDSLLQTVMLIETGHDMDLKKLETGRFSPTFMIETRDDDIVVERSSMGSTGELAG